MAFGGDRPQGVPDTATRIDVAGMRRGLWNRLDNLDAIRITADPVVYPHRLPFVASHNPGAPWSIFLACEPGELDAEAVARMTDAVEAKSHILLCGASMPALASLLAVLDRMGVTPHAAEMA